jgi:hypothetical protein
MSKKNSLIYDNSWVSAHLKIKEEKKIKKYNG